MTIQVVSIDLWDTATGKTIRHVKMIKGVLVWHGSEHGIRRDDIARRLAFTRRG